MTAQPDFDWLAVWDLLKIKVVIVSNRLYERHGTSLGPFFVRREDPEALMGWIGQATFVVLLDNDTEMDLRCLDAYRSDCRVIVARLQEIHDGAA